MTWPRAVRTAADGMTTKARHHRLGARSASCCLAFAVSVDFPKANGNRFKGDESTYYVLGHSLARDFDFQYERKDLIRVWEEFSGPEGVFLKTGKDVEIRGSSCVPVLPMVEARRSRARQTRLYFSKSYIYPLIAAPFIVFFGTNGFLVLHAFLLAFDLLVIYLFVLAATKSNWAAVAACRSHFSRRRSCPVYFVWLMPELLNFSLVLYAVFFWAYKEVAGDDRRSRHEARLPRRAGVRLHRRRARRARDVLEAAAPLVLVPTILLAASRRQWSTRRRHPGHLRRGHRGAVRAERRPSRASSTIRAAIEKRSTRSPASRSPTRGKHSTTSVRCAGARILMVGDVLVNTHSARRASPQPLVFPRRTERGARAVFLPGDARHRAVPVLEAETSLAMAGARRRSPASSSCTCSCGRSPGTAAADRSAAATSFRFMRCSWC